MLGVLRLIGVLSVLLCLYPDHGASLHSSFCIRLPKASLSDATYNYTGEGDVKSVGIEKFPQNIWEKYFWNRERSKSSPYAFLYPSKTKTFFRSPNPKDQWELRFKIKVYSLQGRVTGSRQPLSGWFRLEIEINLDGGVEALLKSFILFARDEQLNPVGEFVHQHQIPWREGSDCPPNDATKYMIIPCGGVGKNEPIASNVILFVRNYTATDSNNFPQQYKEHWPIVPNYGDRHQLNFYYRVSTQDSNRNKNKEVVFKIVADPDENYKITGRRTFLEPSKFHDQLISATAWFRLHFDTVPGAADPLPTDPYDLSCSERVFYDTTINPGNGAYQDWADKGWHWYMMEFYDHPETEVGSPAGYDPTGTRMLACRANTVHSHSGCLSRNYFGGRCKYSFCEQAKVQVHHKKNWTRPIPDSKMVPVVHSETTVNCPSGGPIGSTDDRLCNPLPDKLFVPISNCIGDEHDPPKKFNNKDATFQGAIETLKEVQKGANCHKTEAEAKSIVVTVTRSKRKRIIRRINTTIDGDKKKGQDINYDIVDRRGVRTLGYGTILYSVRKGHGVVMSIVSLFCVPISIFASRYYKETFMETRILYTRPWFQIHIQLVFWMFALYLGGMVIAVIGKSLIGVSLTAAGLAHRIFGWVGFVLFLLVGLTGGIRTFEEPGRTYCIATHWLMGYVVYVMNILSMITSVYIPGSPSADDDESILASEGTIITKMFIVLTFWIVFETVIHVGMTILIYMYDRWMQVEEPRKFIPPVIGVPIPVLKENTSEDASGSGMRMIVLCAYIGIAGLMTAGAIGSIASNQPQPNLGFGAMSCTHEWSANKSRYVMMSKIASECRHK